jgi:hypothetical protein
MNFQIPEHPSLTEEVIALVLIAVIAISLPGNYGRTLLLGILGIALVSRARDITQIFTVVTGESLP